ncbi:translation initiation factor IF-2, mitochondrial isoform X2 [Macrosteles quadrilineatus]|nr:translation initiation factor IF-2, mitochondrial isoform X2 [Macrosteles quadrilineatus]
MTVHQLAEAMDKNVDHIFETMIYVEGSDYFDKPESVITDWKVLQEIVKKSGYRSKIVSPPDKKQDKEELKDITKRPPAPEDQLRPRPPVVTIMGHVDHGKTTLLDTLRQSSIVKSEFGGITQHIGAFSVVLKSGERITMLDTPGHAAFSAMRARGAQATDIVVLVVAADDGVKEQTVESVRMAKEAEVPIIVAINKIDKPGADIERTKRMLAQLGLTLEDSGGDVQAVPISALKGTNVNTLVEAIVLQAELMDLKADYQGLVEGTIIESKVDQARGKLATALVSRGTLQRGSVVVAGLAWGKVRSMFDEDQQVVQQVTPGMATQVIGWRSLPSAGDLLLEVESEANASRVIKWREENKMKAKAIEDLEVIQSKAAEHQEVYKVQLAEKRKLGRRRLKPTGPRQKQFQVSDELKVSVLIKGDVDGSVEAILDLLDTYDGTLCKLELVHYGIGSVTISDVELAIPFQAIIYSFNVGVLKDAEEKAASNGVAVKKHNIIYKLFDDLKEEMEKILPTVEVEERLGEANVLEQFLITEGKKKIPVAGCRCVKGVLKKNAKFRVVRNEEILFEGKLDSMRHLKNEVDTIKTDLECGLRLEDHSLQFKSGDTIICYITHQQPQSLDWDPGF